MNLAATLRRQLTFWKALFYFIMAGGLAALYVRVVYGLGAATNQTDAFPWGLWKGFNVLAGIALGAGGFTLAATVHIFNVEKYKPVLRPAILTAFLGYLVMIIGLTIDIGQPLRIWHPIFMWNPHSVLFEVCWCVMLYLTVLMLELAPAVCERLGWRASLRVLRTISVPVVLFGVVLSTLHQSSLGTIFLIVPYKLYPLWYTPLLPVFFFVSAACSGFAVVMFASWHSAKAFHRQLPLPLLESMGSVLAVLLTFYLAMRFWDLHQRGMLHLLLVNRTETWLFLLEIGLMLAPAALLFHRRVRNNPTALYVCSAMVILGMVANRLNVSLTGIEAASSTHYFPKWSEWMVTFSLIAGAFALFRLAAKHLPIFPEAQVPSSAILTESSLPPAPQAELAFSRRA
ncbi:MAG TPA: Ni/Fe-hydrogenase cytochrome b subunit [Terriglobia bacterium]|nr:Ni/Fe-hydrogenase cytochrome b subunit [Terriglobia bacterium]